MAITMNSDAGHGSAGSPGPDRGRALYGAFIDVLPVDGASISIVTELGGRSTVGASDAVAAQLEARQFQLGVGPHWEALRTRRPAFLYDSPDGTQHALWPAWAVPAGRGGAGALFAFPLQLGAATVGVADLYSRSMTDPWSNELIELAKDVALSVVAAAVRLATRSADAETSRTGGHAVELRREVHQATGMVMAQLDCSAGTALLRLRGQAFASDVPLETLARDVIARRLDFADL